MPVKELRIATHHDDCDDWRRHLSEFTGLVTLYSSCWVELKSIPQGSAWHLFSRCHGAANFAQPLGIFGRRTRGEFSRLKSLQLKRNHVYIDLIAYSKFVCVCVPPFVAMMPHFKSCGAEGCVPNTAAAVQKLLEIDATRRLRCKILRKWQHP